MSRILTKTEIEIAQYHENILNGDMLVIDPSSISSSSKPGYAIYKRGRLEDSGVIDLPSLTGVDLFGRLKYISRSLKEEFEPVDILVIEAIPPVRFGGNPSHHASLLKSIGAIVVSAQAEEVVQIYPVTWKKYIDDKYEKSDAADAEYIGKAVLDICTLYVLNMKNRQQNKLSPSKPNSARSTSRKRNNKKTRRSKKNVKLRRTLSK